MEEVHAAKGSVEPTKLNSDRERGPIGEAGEAPTARHARAESAGPRLALICLRVRAFVAPGVTGSIRCEIKSKSSVMKVP